MEKDNLTNFRLECGQPIHLQQMEQVDASRYQVKLIGWETGESLIVRPPSISHWILLLPSNVNFVARLFAGSCAYGFNTSILCIHHDPFDYFHLVYPRVVESSQVRKAPRVTINIEATLMTTTRKTMAIKVLDISRTGMGILGPVNLADVGDRFQIGFEVTISENPYSFSEIVVVRNTRPSNINRSEKILGVEFVKLDREKALILSGFLYEQA